MEININIRDLYLYIAWTMILFYNYQQIYYREIYDTLKVEKSGFCKTDFFILSK